MAELRTAMQDAQFEMTADLAEKMEDVGKDLRAKIGSDIHDEAEALKMLMQEGNAELVVELDGVTDNAATGSSGEHDADASGNACKIEPRYH